MLINDGWTRTTNSGLIVLSSVVSCILWYLWFISRSVFCCQLHFKACFHDRLMDRSTVIANHTISVEWKRRGKLCILQHQTIVRYKHCIQFWVQEDSCFPSNADAKLNWNIKGVLKLKIKIKAVPTHNIQSVFSIFSLRRYYNSLLLHFALLLTIICSNTRTHCRRSILKYWLPQYRVVSE